MDETEDTSSESQVETRAPEFQQKGLNALADLFPSCDLELGLGGVTQDGETLYVDCKVRFGEEESVEPLKAAVEAFTADGPFTLTAKDERDDWGDYFIVEIRKA